MAGTSVTRILGIKYTHDASIALIEDGALAFSIEMEKLYNRPRRGKMLELAWINDVLDGENITMPYIDFVVVDGWNGGHTRFCPSASYNEFDAGADPADPLRRSVFPPAMLAKDFNVHYSSFSHNAGHIMGGYAMSPFSEAHEDCVVISWDGGQSARAHLLRPRQNKMEFIGELVGLGASVYGNMGLYFGPFKDQAVIDSPDVPVRKFGNVEWPGKLMGFLATGTIRIALLQKMEAVLASLPPCGLAFTGDSHREHQFLRALRDSEFDDADVLASIQEFLGQKLVVRAQAICPPQLPCVFVGGAALNIKWNMALHNSKHFAEVWVPPVANDTGSAIGAAVCENHFQSGAWSLGWSLYSGPKLRSTTLPEGWKSSRPFSAADLAKILADTPDQPIVCLRGRAEIGPRALGHRSILASAARAENKELLNRIKAREWYRPVAPVCLERMAEFVFEPGIADQFMTFEQHVHVRSAWRQRVPAVIHIDGSARVQTTVPGTFIDSVLEAYYRLTGIPLLCNTSANLPGAGFFDSVQAATAWAETVGARYVFADDVLYEKNPPSHSEIELEKAAA